MSDTRFPSSARPQLIPNRTGLTIVPVLKHFSGGLGLRGFDDFWARSVIGELLPAFRPGQTVIDAGASILHHRMFPFDEAAYAFDLVVGNSVISPLPGSLITNIFDTFEGILLPPGIAELKVWAAIALVQMGQEREAMPLFETAFRADPGLADLLPRVAALGLVQVDPALLEQFATQVPGRGDPS